jgi:cellulose synthase/poly-beta-1,6-N-acetylglucosamine synthase-like glycosyltransferase
MTASSGGADGDPAATESSSPGRGRPRPRFIAVVVPAHEEERLIGRCLASIHHSAQHPALGGVEILTIVVADACSDRTAEIAAASGAVVIDVQARNVGSARDVGMRWALRREDGRPGSDLWLATTDADSVVPPHWLAAHQAWSTRGVDAVAGTVTVRDWSEQSAATATAFMHRQMRFGLGNGHGHIHGANLGLSSAAFTRAGGMPHKSLGEDEELWRRVGAAGCRVVRAGDLPVVTSARREARAEGGFGHLLRSLDGAALAPTSRASSVPPRGGARPVLALPH